MVRVSDAIHTTVVPIYQYSIYRPRGSSRSRVARAHNDALSPSATSPPPYGGVAEGFGRSASLGLDQYPPEAWRRKLAGRMWSNQCTESSAMSERESSDT